MLKLVIGSGPGYQHQDDVIALDYIAAFNPDVVRDIKRGIPFDSEKFDEIEMHHVAEHITDNVDFLFVMNECFRVLRNGGYLDITVPHKDSVIAYQCYEHTRFFVEESFMNFYSNPYAKEMGVSLFALNKMESRPKDGGVEVHVILQKP